MEAVFSSIVAGVLQGRVDVQPAVVAMEELRSLFVDASHIEGFDGDQFDEALCTWNGAVANALGNCCATADAFDAGMDVAWFVFARAASAFAAGLPAESTCDEAGCDFCKWARVRIGRRRYN